mmetsp:Transcript_25513/g.79540  ORF Transcript_25513/g.79540 Transcript_25513/m.79540 type:complete len:242 (-) Transcript_25513:559-1284(-)
MRKRSFGAHSSRIQSPLSSLPVFLGRCLSSTRRSLVPAASNATDLQVKAGALLEFSAGEAFSMTFRRDHSILRVGTFAAAATARSSPRHWSSRQSMRTSCWVVSCVSFEKSSFLPSFRRFLLSVRKSLSFVSMASISLANLESRPSTWEARALSRSSQEAEACASSRAAVPLASLNFAATSTLSASTVLSNFLPRSLMDLPRRASRSERAVENSVLKLFRLSPMRFSMAMTLTPRIMSRAW